MVKCTFRYKRGQGGQLPKAQEGSGSVGDEGDMVDVNASINNFDSKLHAAKVKLYDFYNKYKYERYTKEEQEGKKELIAYPGSAEYERVMKEKEEEFQHFKGWRGSKMWHPTIKPDAIWAPGDYSLSRNPIYNKPSFPKGVVETLERRNYEGVKPLTPEKIPEIKVNPTKEPSWYQRTGFNSQPVRIDPRTYDPNNTTWRGEPFQKEYQNGGSLPKAQEGREQSKGETRRTAPTYMLPEVEVKGYSNAAPHQLEILRSPYASEGAKAAVRNELKSGIPFMDSTKRAALMPFKFMGNMAAEASGVPSAYRIGKQIQEKGVGSVAKDVGLTLESVLLGTNPYSNVIPSPKEDYSGLGTTMDVATILPYIGLAGKGVRQLGSAGLRNFSKSFALNLDDVGRQALSPKQLSGSPDNFINYSKYLTQEEAVAAKAKRMLAQKDKWVGQDNELLRTKFKNATNRHNPASENINPSRLGTNSGQGTSVAKGAIADGKLLSEANKSRIAAHETGHYYRNTSSEASKWNSFFDFKNIKKRTQRYLKGKSGAKDVHGTPKKAGFDIDKNVPHGDEIRERAGQLKDYIAQKNGIPLDKDFTITKDMLDDAIKNYVKDTKLDNNMSSMLSSLIDKEGFLKAMNKYALTTTGVTVGGLVGSQYFSNPQEQVEYRNGGSLPKAQDSEELPTYITPEMTVQAFPNATPTQKAALSTKSGNPIYRNVKSQLMNNKQAGNFMEETQKATELALSPQFKILPELVAEATMLPSAYRVGKQIKDEGAMSVAKDVGTTLESFIMGSTPFSNTIPSPNQDWSGAGTTMDVLGSIPLVAGVTKTGVTGVRGLINTLDLTGAGRLALNSSKFVPKKLPGSPNVFYHGGLDPKATLDDIDILKLAQRQQRKGREYAGFYMSPDLNEGSWALKYSKESPTRGLHEITLPKDAKGFVRESGMERITKQEIEKLQKQGYDYIEGKNIFGQSEYVLLNKNKASMKNVSPNNFKSEINWGKWNKEIPENKALMQEYNAIEQQTKADGTWMQNPDGSEFLGTPELFIQSQSKNWVDAYGAKGIDNINVTYRGTSSGKLINNPKYTGVFTGDKNLAKGYAGRNPKVLTPESKGPLGYFKLGSKKSDKSISFDANSDDWGDLMFAKKNKENYGAFVDKQTAFLEKMKSNLRKKISEQSTSTPVQGNNPSYLTKEQKIANIDKQIARYKKQLENLNKSSKNENFLEMAEYFKNKNSVSTDDLANYLEKKGLDNIEIKNIIDGDLGDIRIVNHKKGNYLKSLIGNNGMFDMTNPNIYKSVTGAVGAVGGSQYFSNPQELTEFQDGGNPYLTSSTGSGKLPNYQEGGIPERYKNMGFNKVGVKKKSTRSGKKWMVLAKKGDKYKVVHGGDSNMKDFSQHRSKDRKEKFWSRMGGRNSAKAKNPFSPLYWHKRFGTWQEGGDIQQQGYKDTSPYRDNPYIDIYANPYTDSVNITMDQVSRDLKATPYYPNGEAGKPTILEGNSGNYNFEGASWVREEPIEGLRISKKGSKKVLDFTGSRLQDGYSNNYILNNNFLYTDEELYDNSYNQKKAKEWYDTAADLNNGVQSCTGSACLATENLFPLMGQTGLTTWKEKNDVTSGENNPNMSNYGASVDAWDFPGVVKDKGGKVWYTRKEGEDMLGGDAFNKLMYQLPVGTIINYGYNKVEGREFEKPYYNPQQGLALGSHTAVIVGYKENGWPVVYSSGKLEPVKTDIYGEVANIVTPKEYLQNTYNNLYNKGLLKGNEKLENLKINYKNLENSLQEAGSDEYENYNENRTERFTNSLSENKKQLLSYLNISNNQDYDDLANLATALAFAETKGGSASIGGLVDLTAFGSSKGMTQINKENLEEPEIKKILKEFGIKDVGDLRNPEKSAIATMVLLNKFKLRADEALKKGAPKETEQYRYYRNSDDIQGLARGVDNVYLEEYGITRNVPNAKVGVDEFNEKGYKGYIAGKDDKGYYIRKTTKGNSDLSFPMKMAYYWQSPYTLESGDAQGGSGYAKMVENYYNKLKESPVSK